MADSSHPVRSSVRIYRLLVKAYPASFRKQYEDEMTRVFAELAAETFRRQGAVGLTATWFRVLGDLIATASQEHLTQLQRRPDMKATALTLLSTVAAAFVHLYVMAAYAMTIGLPLAMIGHEGPVMQFALLYLPTFLTGMILARVKPFYLPRLTAPLGSMAVMSIGLLLESGPPWWAKVGFAASIGAVSLLGCIAAKKLPVRLQKLSVPVLYSAGTLAVLVCTSSVGCVLGLLLRTDQFGYSMRPTLIACLAALGLIAVLAVANLVYAAVRQPERTEVA